MKTRLALEALELRELLSQYNLVDLGVRPGDTFSFAKGINNQGIAVGTAGYPQIEVGGDGQAVLFNGETIQQLDGRWPSSANAINDSGWATGYVSHSDSDTAFLTDGTYYQTLRSPPGTDAYGTAVNNSNQVVGGIGPSA